MPIKEQPQVSPPKVDVAKEVAVTVQKEFGTQTAASRNKVTPAKSRDVVNGVARERR